MARIDALDAAKDEYIENGVLLIGLAQQSEKSYKIATPAQKRKLVEIVSSDHVLRDGKIGFTYRKPFDLLAGATSEEKWWTIPFTKRTKLTTPDSYSRRR